MAKLDPTLYNGPARTKQAFQDRPVAAAQKSGVVPLEDTLAPTAAFKAAKQLSTAASRPESTMLEAAQAGAHSWLTTSIVDRFNKPTFEPDGTSASDQLQHAQIILSNDEADLFNKRKSIAEGNYYLESIRKTRENAEALKDHIGVAMIAGGLDPINWAVPFGAAKAAAGAARLRLGVTAARAVASGTAAAASAGVGVAAAQVRPVRTEDIVLNTLLEGFAAPFMVPGKARVSTRGGEEVVRPSLAQADPDFPAQELRNIAKPTVPETIEKLPYIGKAVGAEGEILLKEGTSDAGKFELHYVEDGAAVKMQYATREEALDAFDDAVDYAEADVLVNPSRAGDSKTGPIKDTVMYEDVGLGSKSGDIPEDLTPGIAHDPAKTAMAVDKLMETKAKSWAKRLGEKLQWNVRKSMAAFSAETAKTADILFDNNSNLAVNSVEAHKRVVQAELKTGMWQFDNQLNDAMAESGYGVFNQIFKKGAAEKQGVLEEQVHNEMLRRDQLSRQGIAISHTGVAPRIKAMADSLDRVAKRIAQELKAAGVKGAELLEHHSGWMSRRWDSASLDSIMQRIQKYGHSAEQAKAMVIKMVAESMADANSAKGWSWELAHDVASSTVNRVLRRGALEDAAFNVNQGAEAAKVIRDMLIEDGLTGERLQRVMDVLVGKTDEASKAGFLKHRIDLDYTTNINLGGEQINITELFDHNVKDIFDKYIDKSAAEIALARKGLTSASDVEALLAKDIASIQGMDKRQEYKTLFEESLKHLKGQASGSDLGQALRNTAAISRLTTLGSSGYWQLTEYAKMAQRYGAAKTIGYFVKEMPMFKHALETIATNKLESTHLKDILTNAATESMRLQPYVRRFADGFEMPANATLSARLQHSTQLVPYMNGLKWIHGHQARMMANLTIDSVNRAALGDAKMAKVLEQYGITPEMLSVLKSDVTTHGMQVDAWSNGSWENVRPAFMKMMDEGVLHERIGDTPAFALLNPVGKFISTYRSFVLTSHNKLLAGTLAREGFDGVGLMLMYQYPLAALAVQAQTTINGKKELTGKELAYASLGQTGGLGLIGEVAGLLTGSKTQIGAPGMIPFDRAAKVVGEIGKDIKGTGSTAATMHAAFSMAPFLAILPPIKALEGWYQKEAKEDAKTQK